MNKNCWRLVAVLTILMSLAGGFGVNVCVCAQADSPMVLYQGQSKIISVSGLTRAAVGDETIVDLLALDEGQLLLNPLQPGFTSLHLWTGQGQQVHQLRVVVDDGTLAAEFLTILAVPKVTAKFVDKYLVLEGLVKDKKEMDRAVSLASAYSDSVINLLQVPEDESEERFLLQMNREIQRIAGIQTKLSLFNGTLIVEGQIESEDQRLLVCRLAQILGYPLVDFLNIASKQNPEPVAPVTQIGLAEAIATAIGGDLKVYMIGDTIFLEGLLPDEHEYKRALAIAGAYSKKVEDLLQVKPAPNSDSQGEKNPGPEPLSQDQEELAANLRQLIGDPAISVKMIYDHLLLQGEAATCHDRDRAVKLAQILGYPVVNLVDVKEGDKIAPSPVDPVALIADPDIHIRQINDTLILEGTVTDEFRKTRAAAIAKACAPSVIDLILVRQPLGDPRELEAAVEDEDKFAAHFYQELTRDLIQALKEPEISVSFYNKTLVLEGRVVDDQAKERAEVMAALFYQPMISFVTVSLPKQPDLSLLLAAQINQPEVNVTIIGNHVVLEGTVQDQNELLRVLTIAGLYGEVVDLLTVSDPIQILLQVHIVELNRDSGEQLGLKWGSLDGDTLVPDVIRFEEITHIGSWSMNRSFPLAAQIEALEREGKAKLLAAPQLLTLSGEKASFLVGGEIPIVLNNGDEQTIEWREYGIKLDIDPVVQNGKVRVGINPEVSSLDWSNSVLFNNAQLPGLKTRKTSTTVTVAHGETVVISGLIHHEEIKHVSKVPLLGDLPIIGLLFRSVEYQQKHTELVIFVTPWIIAGGTQDESR